MDGGLGGRLTQPPRRTSRGTWRQDKVDDLLAGSPRTTPAADRAGIIASGPGVGPVPAPMILGRLGDATRVRDLAALRSVAGLAPEVHQSGTVDRHDGVITAATVCWATRCSSA